MAEFKVREIVLPNDPSNVVDYFKAGVLWILAGDEKPKVRRAEEDEKSTFDDEKVIEIVKKAVPGQNSYLMDLTIRSNINEYVIFGSKYTLEEKISKVADSISSFVVA